jgi:hypothetical protein
MFHRRLEATVPLMTQGFHGRELFSELRHEREKALLAAIMQKWRFLLARYREMRVFHRVRHWEKGDTLIRHLQAYGFGQLPA